jgi:hypothetical protein
MPSIIRGEEDGAGGHDQNCSRKERKSQQEIAAGKKVVALQGVNFRVLE